MKKRMERIETTVDNHTPRAYSMGFLQRGLVKVARRKERVQIVKQMLGTAVDRGLQVILLTCDPGAYGGFADQAIELKA